MLKIQTASKKTTLKRRDFLSRTAAVGGVALLGASGGQIHAVGTVTNDLLKPGRVRKTVRLANATVHDFTDLVGQRFHLRTEDGTSVRAKLTEANSPQSRRALRFRREHFSIVFDVTGDPKLSQGQYRLSHPRIGSMDLFMVPVDLPGQHNRLEAVFT